MALREESQGLFEQENVVYTGVGKVNAAYALTKALHEHQPDHVINLGSAGSGTFPTSTLVNCTKFIQRDMDATPFGLKLWQTPSDDAPVVLEYGTRVPDLPEGICGTGDSFDVSGKKADYTLVDMEAYALAKICWREKIPFTCLKFISDGADDNAHEDWGESLKEGSKLMFNWWQAQR